MANDPGALRERQCDKFNGDRYEWLRVLERYLPYLLLIVALLVLHLHMDLTTGDTADFAEQLSKRTVLEYIEFRYFEWTSRILSELVLIFIIHSPVIWTIVDIGAWVLLYWSIIRLARSFGAEREASWLALTLILCYPFATMSEAGWIPTTVSYVFPVSCGLYVLVYVLTLCFEDEESNGPSLKWYQLALLVCATLFGSNAEQVACMLWIVLSVAIFYRWRHHRPVRVLVILWILVSLECLFVVTCPGNDARSAIEEARLWPDQQHFNPPVSFSELGILGKLFVGFTAMADGYWYGYFAGYCLLPGLLALILCCSACTERKGVWIGLAVATGALMLGVPLLRMIPSVPWPWYMSRLLVQPMYDGSLTRYAVAALQAFSWASILAQVYLAVSETSRTKAVFAAVLFGVCIITRIIMGFSPTVFASGYRTNFILDMACVMFAALLLSRLPKRSPARIVCVIAICLCALYAFTHAMQNLTLWA